METRNTGRSFISTITCVHCCPECKQQAYRVSYDRDSKIVEAFCVLCGYKRDINNIK